MGALCYLLAALASRMAFAPKALER